MRRTVSLPKSIDDLVRDAARDEESYSAALARLVEAGAKALRTKRRSAWIGAGEGPRDLSLRAEHYLRESIRRR